MCVNYLMYSSEKSETWPMKAVQEAMLNWTCTIRWMCGG